MYVWIGILNIVNDLIPPSSIHGSIYSQSKCRHFSFFFYVEGLILKIMQKTKALGTQNNSEKNKMEDHSIQFQGIIKLQ